MLRFNLKLVLLSVVLALLVVSAASALLPPSDDFQPSNPYWNGLKDFSNYTNATAINAATQGIVPQNSVLFVIGPSINFTQSHIMALKEYAKGGGTLVLMDETGAINPVLSALGLGVKVDGHPMLDAVFYFRSWKIPEIIDIKGSLVSNVKEMVMDIPSVLRVQGSGFNILAYSSSFSFLDLNGDGEPSPGEPLGPFAVAVQVAYGKGQVMIFSDSSLFLNGVISLGNNTKLLEDIVAGKHVYVDAGVWQSTPQMVYRNGVIGTYKLLSTPELKYSIVFLTVTVIYASVHGVKSYPEVDELQEILAKHPAWDRELLRAMKESRERIGK